MDFYIAVECGIISLNHSADSERIKEIKEIKEIKQIKEIKESTAMLDIFAEQSKYNERKHIKDRIEQKFINTEFEEMIP